MGLWNLLFGWMGGGKLNVDRRFERVGAPIEGDASTVQQVRDKRSGKELALKILAADKLAEFEKRFDGAPPPNEAVTLRKLAHPAFPKLVEEGLVRTGERFLLLDWIDGGSLDQAVRYYSDRLEGKRVSLLRQGAEALAAVHDAGFFHGSVHPANLIVSEDGNSLYLIDFGHTVKADMPLVKTVLPFMSGDYLAPESHRKEFSWRQLEVFAFGVTAYMLCTGKLPWAGDDHSTTVTRAFRAPQDIRKVNPKVPEAVAQAVMKCLNGDPKVRLADLKQFVAQLPADGSY